MGLAAWAKRGLRDILAEGISNSFEWPLPQFRLLDLLTLLAEDLLSGKPRDKMVPKQRGQTIADGTSRVTMPPVRRYHYLHPADSYPLVPQQFTSGLLLEETMTEVVVS